MHVLAITRFQRRVWRCKVGWRANFFFSWSDPIFITRFYTTPSLTRTQLRVTAELTVLIHRQFSRTSCVDNEPYFTIFTLCKFLLKSWQLETNFVKLLRRHMYRNAWTTKNATPNWRYSRPCASHEGKWRRKSIAPVILNLDNSCGWEVSLISLSLYIWCPLTGGCVGPTARLDTGQKKHLLPLTWIEPWFLNYPARSIVSIPTQTFLAPYA